MVTENGIQTYVSEVHRGRTTEDQYSWVAILWIMEWILGPKARNAERIRRPHTMP